MVAKRKTQRTPPRRLPAGCVRYREVHGKIVDYVELWMDSGERSVIIWFKDKTCLDFSLEPSLSVQTDYFDWKSGEQRVIKRWPPVHSE